MMQSPNIARYRRYNLLNLSQVWYARLVADQYIDIFIVIAVVLSLFLQLAVSLFVLMMVSRYGSSLAN